MERWREVWRTAIVPLLSTKSLLALQHGLTNWDSRLICNMTVYPMPGWNGDDSPIAACALGYCGWHGEGLNTVAEVEEFFARLCFEIDQRLGEPSGCRHFLNWFDSTPKSESWPKLLGEVCLALSVRGESGVDTPVVVPAS